MTGDVERVMLSEKELESKVRQLRAQLNEYYKGKKVMVLVTLKGALFFASDLLKDIEFDADIEFVKISSYRGGTTTSGEISIQSNIDIDVEGKYVLIIEDIIDSGNTLSKFVEILKTKNPLEIKTAVLLDKPSRRVYEFEADFVGFEIEDEFVIGYGLDYDEKYRTLPYIGILSRSVYEK